MTIIIATNRMMVADSGVSQGQLMFRVPEPKIIRGPGGALAATAGQADYGAAFKAWFMNGRIPIEAPKIEYDNFCALVMDVDGTVWRYSKAMVADRATEPAVCGEDSAEAFVTGALLAGVSPERAVELACETCVWAKGPVQVERLEPMSRVSMPDIEFRHVTGGASWLGT